jgi:hypothetical protein
MAMVAGSAPASRTIVSTACAVARFCGQPMPWAMIVDSSATTGRFAASAAAISGATSMKRASVICALASMVPLVLVG